MADEKEIQARAEALLAQGVRCSGSCPDRA